MIIVYDTETSGLLAPQAAGVEHQPYLVEFYGIKLNEKLAPIEQLEFRCRPPMPIPSEAIKVHGITNEMIADAPTFAQQLVRLTQFFLGAEIAVGHNVLFDKMVLYYELVRLGKHLNFPWPMKDICTVEISQQMYGYRMNLMDFYTGLFGQGFAGAHSASVDCEMTMRCFVELCNREMVKL